MTAVQLLVLAGLAGIAGVGLVAAEVYDEPCFELGKQWVYEAKDMLLCDRSGRRININKFCKAHLSSASGRLIIDNSKDETSTDPKKQAGHFPELCLPGQRSYALQSPWLCTCVGVVSGGIKQARHRWECVVPENGAGRGLGSDVLSSSYSSGPRSKRSAVDATTTTSAATASSLSSSSTTLGMSTLSSLMSSSVAADGHDEGLGHDGHTHEHNATTLGGIRGRQAAPLTRPNIIIDFCDEFGYVHSVTSSIKECACDRDVIATKLFNFKENDLYQSSGLFSAYECLPGTYNVRCEVCYQDSHTCQPTACT